MNTKIRVLQTLNLLISIYGVVWLWNTFSLMWFFVFIGFTLAYGFLGINVGLHRLFTHRSFRTSRALTWLLALISVPATVGSTVGWVGLHRFHHSNSDQAKDPHSPHTVGRFKSWFGFWPKTVISPKSVHDLIKDPLHRTIHRHYFTLIGAYVLILGLIHPLAIVFVYCMPATYCLHGTSAVSVIGHTHGYRNFECADHSKNSWLLWFLSLGEGWHNNHHKFPARVRQGHKWWELDPAGWLIKNVLDQRPTKPN